MNLLEYLKWVGIIIGAVISFGFFWAVGTEMARSLFGKKQNGRK